jgi:hypothetical protein
VGEIEATLHYQMVGPTAVCAVRMRSAFTVVICHLTPGEPAYQLHAIHADGGMYEKQFHLWARVEARVLVGEASADIALSEHGIPVVKSAQGMSVIVEREEKSEEK